MSSGSNNNDNNLMVTNLILTITSDLNTDDRHYLELTNVKSFDVPYLSGALISKDRIIKISSLEGNELFHFDSNPFTSFTVNKY